MTVTLNDLYITVAEARVFGLGDADTITDLEAERAIEQAMDIIDRITGQWFNVRQRTLLIVPPGSTSVLHLSVPPFEVSEITLEGEALDADTWQQFPDPTNFNDLGARYNPKIVLRSAAPGSGGLFDGRTDENSYYTLVGTWGFVEYDETADTTAAPPDIKRVTAVLAGTIARENPADGTGMVGTVPTVFGTGALKIERTDRHSAEYAVAVPITPSEAVAGWTGNRHLDGILAAYRKPLAIASSSRWEV